MTGRFEKAPEPRSARTRREEDRPENVMRSTEGI